MRLVVFVLSGLVAASAGAALNGPRLGRYSSLEAPASWNHYDNGDFDIVLIGSGTVDISPPKIVVDWVTTNPNYEFTGNEELEWQLKDIAKPLKKGDKNFLATRPVDVHVAGFPGKRMRRQRFMSRRLEDNELGEAKPWKGIEVEEWVLVPMKGGIWNIEFRAPEADFKRFLPDFERALKTLQLRQPPVETRKR